MRPWWAWKPTSLEGPARFDDLLALVLEPLDRPCALVAQSMGGVLALRAADWRAGFRTRLSHLPGWFATEATDLSERLPEVAAPTLLLWGDADPFSPVATMISAGITPGSWRR